jgi:hypothetical protein
MRDTLSDLRNPVLIVVVALACACQRDRGTGVPSLPYATEYPEIRYAQDHPQGRLGALAARLPHGAADLAYNDQRGYLDAVLAELEIDSSSQVLVFSRTSLQVGLIRPETPRAIYFNDDTYVAWVPDAPALEMSGFDPELGPVFFTLLQDGSAGPERQFRSCLRCHDTYSLTGEGVPRFLIGSGYTGTDGELVSHEAWILTTTATSMRSRWGGWYVTGQHGDQVHLGNIVVEAVEELENLDALRVGNVSSLDGLLDTTRYLTPYSDIVALLVLEHQLEVQNLISRVRFESAGRNAGPGDDRVDAGIDDLVRALLMLDEVALTANTEGSSGFAESFAARGPFDASGRSLRQFDLTTRVFRYPLSYLIYSDAFGGLPQDVRAAVYARLRAVLSATPQEDGLVRLTEEDRQAIWQILDQTLPEFAGI